MLLKHLKRLAPFVTAILVFIGFEYILVDSLIVDRYFKYTLANIAVLLCLTWMIMVYLLGNVWHLIRKS